MMVIADLRRKIDPLRRTRASFSDHSAANTQLSVPPRMETKKQARCGVLDGLNADDPGLRLLTRHAQHAGPARMLSAYSGPFATLGGATRVVPIILDVREESPGHPCIRTHLDGLRSDKSAHGDVVPAQFDAAACWPRAHLGKDLTLAAFARAGSLLKSGAPFWCCVRKQKGGASLARALSNLFGEVEVVARERGYHLYEAIRADDFDQDLADEWAHKRYMIEDPLLGELSLVAAPGVFSRRELDAGTATLIDFVDKLDLPAPRKVLDLCAGIGPLALWASQRWAEARIDAVESNLVAVSCLEHNARSAGVSDRVQVHAHAGPVGGAGPYDLAMINPPTHADGDATRALLAPLATQMRPGAAAYLVLSRAGKFPQLLEGLGARVRAWQSDRYTILGAKW